MKVADLHTPCLVLEERRLERNVTRKRKRAAALGVDLRIHLKTCKSAQVADRMLGSTRRTAAVSTIAEAAFFFKAGTTRDLRYTSPFSPEKVALVASWLKSGLNFEVLLDDPVQAGQLGDRALAEGVHLPIVLEIDVDGNRGGADPAGERFAALRRIATEHRGLIFRGIYSYAGGTYRVPDRADRQALVELHRRTLVDVAANFRADGHMPAVVGIGSSPALEDALSLQGLTEACAGVFGFQDLAQRGIGVCSTSDIAVSVLASVVQVNPETGRVFIDAGGIALSQDRSTASQREDQGYGLVCDAETCEPLGDGEIVVLAVSQEHGRVARRDGTPADPALLPVGRKLRILPNHTCMTVDNYEGYHVLEGARIMAFWPRIRGWGLETHNIQTEQQSDAT